jgi:hypothetical protein
LIEQVFTTWREALGKNSRTVLDKNRAKVIKAALASYPVEDVCDAVRGLTLSSFHMGTNDRHKRYDDVHYAIGTAAKIEEYRDLWRDRSSPTKGALSPEAERDRAYHLRNPA